MVVYLLLFRGLVFGGPIISVFMRQENLEFKTSLDYIDLTQKEEWGRDKGRWLGRKSLLCEHEGLSRNGQHLCKRLSGVAAYTCNLSTGGGGRDRWTPSVFKCV